MDMEPIAAHEVSPTAVSGVSGVNAHAEGFGTRPSTGRPHSISLFGADQDQPRGGASRGLDVLLGAGIGAAVMYYFDPDGGPRRRARARETIVGAVTMAPDGFDASTQDASWWLRQAPDAQPRSGGKIAEWTPGGRLVASAVGGALTLIAARRRDVLGAAVGLVGSALLARGVTKNGRPAPWGA
jgi:hypothetical protein